jgi:hypothetical protein
LSRQLQFCHSVMSSLTWLQVIHPHHNTC